MRVLLGQNSGRLAMNLEFSKHSAGLGRSLSLVPILKKVFGRTE